MNLNEKIFQHRKKLGLSQEELANRLGVTRQSVSKWELGDSQPDLDMIVKLAKLFGVSTDYLLQADAEIPQNQTHWLDRIPGVIGKLIRQYGWLCGVYLALVGAAFFIVGLLSAASVNSIMGDFGSLGMMQTFDISIYSMPIVMLVIGIIITAGGIALATWLKRRSKQ